MSRFLRASILLLLLASCGGGGKFSAPRNLDDACALLRERPEYYRAMKATEKTANDSSVPVTGSTNGKTTAGKTSTEASA